MIALGLRAHPQHVTFAVVAAADLPSIQTVSCVRMPAALHLPEQLAFVRTMLLDIVREHQVTEAGVRTTEPLVRRPNVVRASLEGVLQELLGAGTVPRYFAGPLARMGGLLRLTATEVKKHIDGHISPHGVDGWAQKYDAEQREAILAALAALRLERPRLTTLAPDDSHTGSEPVPVLDTISPITHTSARSAIAC